MGKSRILSEISKLQSLVTQETFPSHLVPLVFREPGVLTGYRPSGKQWGYYVISVFKIHNETVNIWTHGIPIFFFIYKFSAFVQAYVTSGDDVFWLLAMFGVLAMINTILSTFAHSFHSKSFLMHYLCYQGDYAGIAILGLGKSILFFHTSSSDSFYEIANRISLPAFVLLTWLAMSCNCIAKLRYKRPYPIPRKLMQLVAGLIQGLIGGIPVISQYVTCLLHSECAMTSLNHHSIWLLTMMTSLFFFSSHLPEKKYPGTFDFIGQGHHIFHVLISLTVILEFDGAFHDVRIGGLRSIDISSITLAIVTSVIGCGLFILCMLKMTKKRILNDEKDT